MKYGTTVCALAALALIQAPGAAIIKVYDQSGGRDYEAMAVVAESLKNKYLDASGELEKSLSGEVGGFGYRIVPGSRVTPDLSMAPGSSAYFWSSASYKYEPGFTFKGGPARFRTQESSAALKKETAARPPVSYATAVNSASVSGGSLAMRYSLAKPAVVSVRIVSLDGKVAGRWSWREGSAGRHFRQIDARLAHGVYLLHWSGDGAKWSSRLKYDGAH